MIFIFVYSLFVCGWVVERFMALVLKTSVGQPTGGSNPSPSATLFVLIMEDAIKWLRLARCRGFGSTVIRSAAELFGYNVDVLLENLPRIHSRSRSNKPINIPTIDEIAAEFERIVKFGGNVVSIADDNFPPLLKDLHNAPILLTYKGNVNLLKQKCLSIVGTRTPCLTSMQFAESLSGTLVKNGFVIASGLAQGIDTCAHKAAMVDGKTIGVIGSGISKVYPPENAKIFDKMMSDGGIVVSEFEFDASPIPSNFPQRNRIIAGISLGTIVVEARLKSGSLITANYAHSFNREVYAVPGFPTDMRYAGNNELIKKQVAKMIENADDVINDLSGGYGRVMEKSSGNNFADSTVFTLPNMEDLEELQVQIENLLSSVPISINELAMVLGAENVQYIRVILLEMQMSGKADRTIDGKYIAILSH